MAQRYYGVIRDSPDHRDIKYELKPKTIQIVQQQKFPELIDLRKRNIPDPYNQFALGSCTGNSIGGALHIDRRRLKLPEMTPSRLFIYYNERDMMGTVMQDSGASLRDGVKTINMYGVPSEEDWPYIIEKFTEKAPDEVYRKALLHPKISYARIDNTKIDQIKGALFEGFPIVFGCDIYESFESEEVSKTGKVPFPNFSKYGYPLNQAEEYKGGHAMCFTSDTKVKLLNGTVKTFKELIDEKIDTFWVYSSDSDGNVVPGLAHSPRKTRNEMQQIIKITLDNGESIKCTHDHLFMMRDGTYRKAENLKLNDSLMPLYTKHDDLGYEMIWDNRMQQFRKTHNMVYYHFNKQRSEVIHHSDFNKLNNSPENLFGMTWDDHTKLHNEYTILLEKYAKSDTGRQKSKELMNKLWENPEWKNTMLIKNKNSAEKGRYKRKLKSMYKEISIKQLILNDVDKYERQVIRARNNLKKYNEGLKNGEYQLTEKQIETRSNNLKVLNKQKWNHKVIGIEYLKEKEYVYDITVEGYHNFALDTGVFVHNCIVGYDDNEECFIVRNSWGKNWGDKGYCYMPYAYLTNRYIAFDFWVMRIILNTIQKINLVSV